MVCLKVRSQICHLFDSFSPQNRSIENSKSLLTRIASQGIYQQLTLSQSSSTALRIMLGFTSMLCLQVKSACTLRWLGVALDK